uniref:Nuclear receptor subfamily 1, group D, member 4a n=1 Tax=Cyprinus carpio TaxID=7962 RepID=A0A8C1IGZ9_CYPCA
MDSSPGGVILYAGSNGSASPSPGSPSSGYQTQSPSSHSQPSSPEDFTFTEIGALKQQGSVGTPPSPKLVFQFPEIYSNSTAGSNPHSYSHPIAGKRPCGFTGTFTKTGGMVLLCKVCGDIASGFHYGVHACEGCKVRENKPLIKQTCMILFCHIIVVYHIVFHYLQGFFRRSIQQNINYKMCVKNENCTIMRMNRNRCQHCRFKKCLSVGMSRDAVRFGRIPKREKQRLLDEMQSYMNSLNESSTMGMETSPPCEPPPSPSENQSKEALSRAYQDIFTNTQEHLSKRAGNMNTSSGSNTFQNSPSQDSNYPHVNSLVGFHATTHESFTAPPRCPVASSNSKCPVSLVDNNRYSYAPSFSQNHSQSSVSPPSQPTHADYNIYVAGESQSQASCPFKLAAGSKVLACPLNACPVSAPGVSSQQVWETFSQCFTPAVREVVEFAKGIPGFQELCQHDQVMLLKAGTFQVLMVRFCSLFNHKDRTVTFLNGQTYPLVTLRGLGMGSLLNAMFEFSSKLSSLGLESDEMALFMAVVLVSADCSGILDTAAVEQLQEGLIRALRTLVTRRRPDDNSLFPKLLLRLPDLRTLNTLHSDKLLAFRIDP